VQFSISLLVVVYLEIRQDFVNDKVKEVYTRKYIYKLKIKSKMKITRTL